MAKNNEGLKDQIREYLGENLEQLLEDINSLPPKERVDKRMKLMDYVLPKIQAVSTNDAPTQTMAASILDREAEE
jgi:hypothetical protein